MDNLNWKQILVSGIVTVMVTIVAGMLLFYLQMREASLTYFVDDTAPFVGDSENLGIYQVTVRNDGKKEIENVIAEISLPGAIVKQKKVSPKLIVSSEQLVDNVYTVNIQSLNPQETFVISLLASSNNLLPIRPDFTLRGKGVNGKEFESNEAPSPTEENFITIAIAIVAAFAGLLTTLAIRQRTSAFGISFGGEQREVFLYLCGVHKLYSEVEKYSIRQSRTSYWSESDRFAALALENLDTESEKRKKVLIDLVEYANMAKSSKGIVYYNIARIAKAQENDQEAKEFLEKAKKIVPKLIDKRINLDGLLS